MLVKKPVKIISYCFVILWFFYQVNILNNGYQKWFLIFMIVSMMYVLLRTIYSKEKNQDL